METPKANFLLSGLSADFKKVSSNSAFLVACDYALMELQCRMAPNTTPGLPTDPYIGIDANAQMFGARRVIEILQSLSEPVKQPSALKRESLYHE